uniref:G-protein coupled receptors family 3 profile domain-containing protein n=1 Tax=Entomoneis paludosa TaxID=265537 RepID=A0A6U3DGF0_9STRA|mmetsp:Transcript_4218/g.9065  ORF Transcript_4218/g.9065 Transcript_4218/m.9065 type:complete len:1436 (+) Transcript_4218:583-4890(+)|eukprot:CAMPEP_0172454106 /NCGR_PEP_ID=MMETSP1065-20121228/11187_1 /TAXON_ID=265537 /ORGANISM="Amphiprora paludosa, Strain CCMP125" /LENGTH=1435 /DNA_ID=CAMNT_0013206377 /DNA_START=623 /DNA_END=4930 /DNA_ORIENTATION=+
MTDSSFSSSSSSEEIRPQQAQHRNMVEQESSFRPHPQRASLVVTSAPLLSGRLRDCALGEEAVHHFTLLPEGEEEEYPCHTGGLAAVQAWIRHYHNNTSTTNDNDTTPVLTIPMGDFKAPLTTLSRFGYGVNTLLYQQVFGWRTWTLPAYTLWPERLDNHALYHAQDATFPALVSNVFTAPHEPWHPYVKSIHYDDTTQLALIYLTKDYLSNTVSQIQSTRVLLQAIFKTNMARDHCDVSSDSGMVVPALTTFAEESFAEWWMEQEGNVIDAMTDAQQNASTTTRIPNGPAPSDAGMLSNCYRPVVVWDDKDASQFDAFVQAFSSHSEEETRYYEYPLAIVDIWGHAAKQQGQDTSVERLDNPAQTWLVSYQASRTEYHQVQFTWNNTASSQLSIDQAVLSHQDLQDLPSEVQTPEYWQDLENVRQYARQAYQTALVTEQGIASQAMPPPTTNDNYRHCYLGECALGNVVANAFLALDNHTADVAFLPSFLLDGPGWKARDIHYLELLENIPYAAQTCTGTLTGLHLLRVLQNSLDQATFDPYDGTRTGGRLLQVAGMQIVYHSPLQTPSPLESNENDDTVSRIVSVDIWDKVEQRYAPLEKQKLYKFVSNTHLCFTFSNFPELLDATGLQEMGEVPATKRSQEDMKDVVHEYLLSTYGATGKTLEPFQDPPQRLIPSAIRQTPMEYWTDRQGCEARSNPDDVSAELQEYYWDAAILECKICPLYGNVVLSKSEGILQGQALQSDSLVYDEVTLTNLEKFTVGVTWGTLSLPSYIEYKVVPENPGILNSTFDEIGASSQIDLSNATADNNMWVLSPNQSLKIEIAFDPSERSAGTDTSSLVFEFSDYNRVLGGCPGSQTKYTVVAQLSLSTNLNHLDGVAAFGYTSAALVIMTSLSFGAWVARRRKARVVLVLQPVFLITLALGVLLIGAALIPFSIDDGVASHRGCDIACMAKPWLLSHGVIISVAALFCKLLRINRVVQGMEQHQTRLKIEPKDVILPASIFVLLNFVFMVIWTVADPMHWERFEVDQQPWNTYGKCHLGDGTVGKVMFGLVVAVCTVSFIMTCWQAFRARNISSEFSESRYLGIAIYSWVQLCVVGVPVYFLVDEDDVVVKYSLIVGLLLAVCMSMLLVVFVPILAYKERQRSRRESSGTGVRIGPGERNVATDSIGVITGSPAPTNSVTEQDQPTPEEGPSAAVLPCTVRGPQSSSPGFSSDGHHSDSAVAGSHPKRPVETSRYSQPGLSIATPTSRDSLGLGPDSLDLYSTGQSVSQSTANHDTVTNPVRPLPQPSRFSKAMKSARVGPPSTVSSMRRERGIISDISDDYQSRHAPESIAEEPRGILQNTESFVVEEPADGTARPRPLYDDEDLNDETEEMTVNTKEKSVQRSFSLYDDDSSRAMSSQPQRPLYDDDKSLHKESKSNDDSVLPLYSQNEP